MAKRTTWQQATENKTPRSGEFINDLKDIVTGCNSEVVTAVPFVCIPGAVEAAKGSILNSWQNVH